MNIRAKLLIPSLTALACLMAAATASAAEFNLRWGHYLGKGPFLDIEMEFARKIAKRTGGRVKIDITFASGLGKGNEVLTLAGRGAIDMASAPPSYYAEQLLYWKVFQMPFIFKSPTNAMDVLAKSLKEFPVFMQEMDKMNVVWLFQQPLGSYFLTGPSPNCDSLAGLKGKKSAASAATCPRRMPRSGRCR